MPAVWHILYSWSKGIVKRHFFSEHCVGTSSKLLMFAMEMLCGMKRKRWRVSGRCILLKEISNSKTYLKMRISINKQFRERRTSEYLCLGEDIAINSNLKVVCPILI